MLFERGRWIYFLALLLSGVAILYMNVNQIEYSLLDSEGKVRQRRDGTVYVITFLLVGYIIFWAAIRNGITDTYTYIGHYNHLSTKIDLKYLFTSENVKAPFFELYQILLKRMGLDFHWFIGSVSVASGICIYYAFSRYSDDVAFSFYLLMTSMYFYSWLMNGIRQFLVVCIFFAALRLIAEKKLVKLLVLVAFCYFIHKSAIIMIPIYFISNMKNWNWGIYACVLATMAVALIFPDQFLSLVDDSFSEYNIIEQSANDDGVNVLRFLVAMVPAVLAFAYRERLREFDNPYIKVMTNMALVTAGLYAVGVTTSGILMGRLPVFTEIFNFLFLPFLIRRVLPKSTRGPVWVMAIILYFLHFYLQAKEGKYYTTDIIPGLNNSVV